MTSVAVLRARTGLSQRQLAELSATSQPTIAAYESGRKSPTLRTLRRIAAAAGFSAEVVFVTPLTREDRRSLALHDAIAEHIAVQPDSAMAAARQNIATMRVANPHAAPLLDEWQRLVGSGPDHVLDAMRDPSERGRALRQVSPFGGILSAPERAQVYRRFRQLEDAARRSASTARA